MGALIPRGLAAALVMYAGFGCANVEVDPGERSVPPLDGPTAEFDPSAKVIPFPDDLLIDPSTGKVALPEPCNEGAAAEEIRVAVLNKLDGFGTYEPAVQVSFSEPIDESSLDGRVWLVPRTLDGVALDPAVPTAPVPIAMSVSDTQRANAACDRLETVTTLTIVPEMPLVERSDYDVVLGDGITTEDGVAILPSSTWALIRQEEDPVTVDANGTVVAEQTPLDPVADADVLRGIDQLWKALHPALAFLDDQLGLQREQLLLAWEFHTQTTTDPLDVSVPNSLAAGLPDQPIEGVDSITGGAPAPAFLAGVLGEDTCKAVGCDAVGEVLGGVLQTPRYQVDVQNPMPGGDALPGPWSDPVAPERVRDDSLSVLAFVPASPEPPAGYPVVVFGHGLTRSKKDLFAIGPQLAAAGFASVAINWVDSGDRAVRTSSDAALGCAGSPDPSAAPQCFAPIVSSDLATTRDNLRQSALDAMALVQAVSACSTDECGDLEIDPQRIGYLGQSLGSLLGAVVVAASPDIRAAVLDVGGAGWVDIVENTDNLGIRCPVIDSLVQAGVISGTVSDLTAQPPTGTCVGDSWRQDPGWLTFANIGRWVLDPADGANFVGLMGQRPLLLQEVVGDSVVPNVATERYARLLDIDGQDADVSSSPDTVSAAITTHPLQPKLVRYKEVAAMPSAQFPGNSYSHGSLLAPADNGPDGLLGTALLQHDAITYLDSNLAPREEVQP